MTQYGTQLNIQFALPAVTVKQIKSALASQLSTVAYDIFYQSISADVTDPVNIVFNTAGLCWVGDPLYNFIQSNLSYTNVQMVALFNLATTFSP